MAPSEETIRNLKLYLLPSIALTFLVITIALVIVVYVDNREIDSKMLVIWNLLLLQMDLLAQ